MAPMGHLITVTLWTAIVGYGVMAGGAFYEHLVVTPLWTRSPPRSLRAWNQDPDHAILRARFWRPGTAPLVLCAPLLLVAGAMAESPARLWFLVSGACASAILVATIVYFIPVQKRTIDVSGAGATDDAIVRDTAGWVFWNRFRVALVAVGWAAAIAALAAYRG
jgi:uncharacterized membrane protein